jgi:hypothetical protein
MKPSKQRTSATRSREAAENRPAASETPDGQFRDADGLLVDEYSDPTIKHQPGTDALDNPTALTSDALLDDVALTRGGPQEIDLVDADVEAESLGDGGRKVGLDQANEDDAATPHSADDLARVTIGDATRKGRGIARGGLQQHGEDLLDSPDV